MKGGVYIFRKVKKQEKNENVPKDPPIKLENMTPWQKENVAYHEEKGDAPTWHPSVIQVEAEVEKRPENNEEQEVKLEPNKDYVSFTEKLPNVKKIRYKRLKRRLTFILTILAILLLVALYFVSPLSKVGAIKVTGNQEVSQQAISQASKIKIGGSLWEQFYDRQKFEKNVANAFPRVKTVKVGLSGINHLQVQISEFETVAYAAKDEKYYPVLENGTILTDSVDAKGDLPVIENFSDKQTTLRFLEEYSKLAPEIKNMISEAYLTPTENNQERVTFYMNDGNSVIANIRDFSGKMKYYPKVASQLTEKGIIDMEVGIFSQGYGEEEKKDEKTENN